MQFNLTIIWQNLNLKMSKTPFPANGMFVVIHIHFMDSPLFSLEFVVNYRFC